MHGARSPVGARPRPVRRRGWHPRGGCFWHRADAASSGSRPGPPPVLRAVPLRPPDRPLGAGEPVAAAARQTFAVRGAGVGDLRAADRVRARRRDPAAASRGDWGARGKRAAAGRPGRRDARPQAPALLESLGLSAGRAIALVRAAREVAAGRVDLFAADPEPGWRRLRAIPGIGSWTVQMLALTGQGAARPAPGRRPRLPEAGGADPQRRRPVGASEHR